MDFLPDNAPAKSVPFLEDATGDGGWQGHASSKSIDSLKREVQNSLARLGGSGVTFQSGKFVIGKQSRLGWQINYVLSNGDQVIKGRIAIASLPMRREISSKRERTLKMALYMLRMALDGAWFLEQLSPGYAALIPWMLNPSTGQTLTEAWTQGTDLKHLLPPGDADFIEGEFKEK